MLHAVSPIRMYWWRLTDPCSTLGSIEKTRSEDFSPIRCLGKYFSYRISIAVPGQRPFFEMTPSAQKVEAGMCTVSCFFRVASDGLVPQHLPRRTAHSSLFSKLWAAATGTESSRILFHALQQFPVVISAPFLNEPSTYGSLHRSSVQLS